MWNFDNSYARLPEIFFERVRPAPVRDPALLLFNENLAAELGLDRDSPRVYAGNEIPVGAEPLAQAYAGHQFGHFTMLGDGRANLLGEHVTPSGRRFDIQLKGSGPTQYSRRGDGRAGLGPMLREYIISEAMAGLKIPTTRGLAVVTTGEGLRRQTPTPGAVLTRVADSHIRVGTFEYAAALSNPSFLRTLADYTIQRHYPGLDYLSFLNAVIEKQAKLIAQWMLVGFIHGVMNTDNMAVSGETIDYGPCAFMDKYSLATVFSSIDRDGRYAFGNQPQIAEWNLARFAETLLPLFSADENQAAQMAVGAVENFGVVLQREWLSGMRGKLGLADQDAGDLALFSDLLKWMQENGADYTNTFRALPTEGIPGYPEWEKRWRVRKPNLESMATANPAIIPRNHRVEEALQAATENENLGPTKKLLAALANPFLENPEFSAGKEIEGYQTFCGT